LLPRFVKVLREERPDIVHTRNWCTIEAVLAARLAGVRRIVHSEHGRDHDPRYGEPYRRRVYRRLCYALSDRVFAVSEELRDYYTRQLRLKNDRIAVIPNGVDTDAFRPDSKERMEWRKRLNAAESAVVVGCIGRFYEVKDQSTLLRGVAQAAGPETDLRVVLVGDGTMKTDLEYLAQTLPGLRNRVVFVGETDLVRQWLNSFDIFVLPSISEGMSNTLLEAMAVGLPPIVTHTGGNTEVIEEGTSGISFSPRDHQGLARILKHLASSPDNRRIIGERARHRVLRNFSLNRMLQSYEKLYTDLADTLATQS
jgi:sugar transferase (PEP-CTERM/EpsH1 system associated)